MSLRVSQAELLARAEAHNALRRVLTFVRGQEKFDPRVIDLVPEVIEYFSNRPSQQPAEVAPAADGSKAA